MVLPGVMESEDNLNEYVKLRNIEGKVLIKKTCKHDNFEEEKGDNVDENLVPIENNNEAEKLEFDNFDDVTSRTEQESLDDNEKICDRKTPEIDKGSENKRKGILKYERTYSNKHVDFNMDLEFVPFDESKDYTIEIQIVEQMPKKIVSYAALFAQQKKEEEEKLKKEAEEKEKQNRKHKKKRKHLEWKKNRKQDIQKNTPIPHEVEHNITHNIKSQLAENDSLENHLSTEDETEDEKEDFSENSYYSDTDKEEHSETTISLESESNMCVEDHTSTNRFEEAELECKRPADDLNKPSNDTATEMDTKQVCNNEPMKSEYQKSFKNENCDNSIISESIQLFCVPAKKQRSNSLSDLEDSRKPHRFVVQRLPREIELIISRQLEQQYYE